MAAAWQAEPAKSVRRPPIRSATQPQNCRLTKAVPSSTESITAPRVGEIPTSVQRATRWLRGIAMGMQQRKDAKQSSAKVAPLLKPTARTPAGTPSPAVPALATSGGGRRKSAASGMMLPMATRPKSSIVCRQPTWATSRSKIGGQRAPATDWPLEIRASAVPRRRSNQWLT